MIYANKGDFARYCAMHPRFQKAFDAMIALAAQPFEKGRHGVDGEEIFINAAEYDTKPQEDSFFEAHRKYVDIMLMLEGEERIGCKHVEKLASITRPYDENGDALIAAMEEELTSIHMTPGDMVVFFPEDGHAPGMDWNKTSHVKKLIAKVML